MKKSIKIFDIINIFILSLFGIICVFPFVYEILISFSSKCIGYIAVCYGGRRLF